MKQEQPNLHVYSIGKDFYSNIECIHEEKDIYIFRLKISSDVPKQPRAVKIVWSLPSLNVKGIWKPSIFRENRIQYDWEQTHLESRISINAPVVCVYSHNDENIATFAVSDAINPINMNALLREEDNSIYFHFELFKEKHPKLNYYEIEIRIDTRKKRFSEVLVDTSKWWETFEAMKPMYVPPITKAPFYCTWYQFHQNLDEDTLLKECKLAKSMGFESIIIDDGWQTLDCNRGYDYTGDWKPLRIPNMKKFVDTIHAIGLKVILWYSVPFCGIKSKAYQKFKDKLLTKNHRWAPVFDPRYPEVREHLINIYTSAIQQWNLDGFKLDFIDEFKAYLDTELTLENGRDYASVDAGTERLMTDTVNALLKINPEIVIEFRQQYTGPAMRKYGNMFRAFDCPTDSHTNRVRTTDVKMLCGNSAVHSDPLTWNQNETVEAAALQVLSSIFTVPQVSVNIEDLPKAHFKMLQFYISFWKEHSDVLLGDNFTPYKPLLGYPLLTAFKEDIYIAGIYDSIILDLEISFKTIYLINATIDNSIALKNHENFGDYKIVCFNCQGNAIYKKEITLFKGLISIEAPICGLLKITQIINQN